jgi:hypothetical protein
MTVLADLHIVRSITRYVIKHRPDHHAEVHGISLHSETSRRNGMVSHLSCLLFDITSVTETWSLIVQLLINASLRAAPDRPCPADAMGCSGRNGCKAPTWPWGSTSFRTQAWSRPGRSFLRSVEARPRTDRQNTGGWICHRDCWRCIRRIASWGSS